jgi:hypothetical protein
MKFLSRLFRKNKKEELTQEQRETSNRIMKEFLKAKNYANEKNIDLVEAYKQLKLGDYHKDNKSK